MEPAVERREHETELMTLSNPPVPPQWSPPLRGGSTREILNARRRYALPQWSPPLRGGSTYGICRAA